MCQLPVIVPLIAQFKDFRNPCLVCLLTNFQIGLSCLPGICRILHSRCSLSRTLITNLLCKRKHLLFDLNRTLCFVFQSLGLILDVVAHSYITEPRMAWVGRDLKAHLVPKPAMSLLPHHQIRLLRVLSSLSVGTAEKWSIYLLWASFSCLCQPV